MGIDGAFRGSAALANGRLTRGRRHGSRYQRIFSVAYCRADLSLDLEIRSRAAYLLVRDRGGVLAGYSAAWALGAGRATAGTPAEVLVRRACRTHPGLVVRQEATAEQDVVEAAGCRVTSPPRTAWDLCRRLSPVEAVVALDAVAPIGRFAPDELLVRRLREPGRRGCRRPDEIVAGPAA